MNKKIFGQMASSFILLSLEGKILSIFYCIYTCNVENTERKTKHNNKSINVKILRQTDRCDFIRTKRKFE